MLKKLNFTFLKTLPAHEKRITLATLFTLTRILLTPVIVGAMIAQQWGVAFFLFVAASATDVIDGNLARFFNTKTFLGAVLDPIADKVLLLSCFFALAFVQSPLFSIPLWFVVLVLLRELILIGGALLVFLVKGQLKVNPTWLGKLTTFVQICFIVWLFACYFFHWLPVKTYYTMLALMLMLTFCSFVQYARIGWQQFIGS